MAGSFGEFSFCFAEMFWEVLNVSGLLGKISDFDRGFKVFWMSPSLPTHPI